MVPRSIVVLAPISTSSSICTMPTCGIFMFAAAGGCETETIAADNDSGMENDAFADQTAPVDRNVGVEYRHPRR